LKNELSSKKTNLQNRAREIRYDFFSGFLKKQDSSLLFLAHHSDDQIETFFLHYFRNSGIAGLSGMRQINNRILRPLLEFSKEDIVTYAKENEILWREDSSNSKNDYLRNRLRNELIPFLVNEIPTLKSSVLKLVSCFQENQNFLENEINELKQHLIDYSELDIEFARKLTNEKLIELFRQLTIPAGILSEWQKLIKSQKGSILKLPETSYFQKIIREKDTLLFVGKIPQVRKVPKFTMEIVSSLPKKFDKNTLYLDMKKLEGELYVRTWQKGDRIFPIGIDGSKLISDVLTHSKVSNYTRKDQWVLCDQKKIISCLGFVIDRRAIANGNSQQILKVEITFVSSMKRIITR
jgi:tRNA(Ile)-lysidine synthase